MALRGDPLLYHQVLDIFHSHNAFQLTEENGKIRDSMASSLFKNKERISAK